MNHSIQSHSPRVRVLDYDACRSRDGCDVIVGANTWFGILPFSSFCVHECNQCGEQGIFNQDEKISYAYGPRSLALNPWWELFREASTKGTQVAGSSLNLDSVIGDYTFLAGSIIKLGSLYRRVTSVGGTASDPILGISPALSAPEAASLTAGTYVFPLQNQKATMFAASAGSANVFLEDAGDLSNFVPGQRIYIEGNFYTILSITGSPIHLILTTPLSRDYAAYTPIYDATQPDIMPMDQLWVAYRAEVGIKFGLVDEIGRITLPSTAGEYSHLGLTYYTNALGLFEYDELPPTDLHGKKVSLSFTDWGTPALNIFDYDPNAVETEISWRRQNGDLASIEWAATSSVAFNYNTINIDDPPVRGLVVYYIRDDAPGSIFARFEAEDFATERLVLAGMRITLAQLVTMLPNQDRISATLYAKDDTGRCVVIRTPAYYVNINDQCTVGLSMALGSYTQAAYPVDIEELASTLGISMDSGLVLRGAEPAVENVFGLYKWIAISGYVQKLSGTRHFTSFDLEKFVRMKSAGLYARIKTIVSISVAETELMPDADTNDQITLYTNYAQSPRNTLAVGMVSGSYHT